MIGDNEGIISHDAAVLLVRFLELLPFDLQLAYHTVVSVVGRDPCGQGSVQLDMEQTYTAVNLICTLIRSFVRSFVFTMTLGVFLR